MEYLHLAIGKWYVVLHIPNGGKRNRVEAAILKGLGVRAGASDILISGAGFSGFIEVKDPEGGKLRKSQEEFRDECLSKGIPWAEARNVDDAVAFVKKHELANFSRQLTRLSGFHPAT